MGTKELARDEEHNISQPAPKRQQQKEFALETTMTTMNPITLDPHSLTTDFIANSQPEERLRVTLRSGRKQVRFAETITKCDSSVHYITEEEREALWYTKKELNSILKDSKKLLQVARLGLNDGSNEFCLRGLEDSFSRRSRIETRRWRDAVRQAVFMEQLKQRTKKIHDPSRLRRKCSAASKPPRQFAFELAGQDAMDVRAFRRADAPRFHRSQSCPDRQTLMKNARIDRSTRTIIV
jgi:hypothetical protein